jgi:hypothetical protein
MMVGDELKSVALGEDRGFVVGGAILEVEDGLQGDVIVMDGLNDISRGNDAAVGRTHFEEAVDTALDVADDWWIGLGEDRQGAEQNGAEQPCVLKLEARHLNVDGVGGGGVAKRPGTRDLGDRGKSVGVNE